MNKTGLGPFFKQGLARMRETAMCDKCIELDGKIDHYQRLASQITDQATLDGIKQLIERMKAQKVALHPQQEQ
jgi:hypothetical protein